MMITLVRTPGGGEMLDPATPSDLRLSDYSRMPNCCICRNFAVFQLQPLVEPQPSQT
jgi:hypothetical protein